MFLITPTHETLLYIVAEMSDVEDVLGEWWYIYMSLDHVATCVILLAAICHQKL